MFKAVYGSLVWILYVRYYNRSATFPACASFTSSCVANEGCELSSENLSEHPFYVLEFGTPPLGTSCASLFISLLLVSI